MIKATGHQAFIDADGHILGRLASRVAKRLLCGEKITIVNADKILVSGSYGNLIQEYKERLRIRTLVNPAKGPFHQRRPDGILRRTIRGMLPWDRVRGKEAFRRLAVFIGVPPELKSTKFELLPEARMERLRGRFVRLEEISKELGWRPLSQK
ncbi:MAG: 50S ribosomal protein L13 [Candidatus Atabeyarchaeum deiterrae]